jgi:hypothetical protein
VALVFAILTSTAAAQSPVTFVGLGDSIGEGVQSGDASEFTQPFSFLSLIAWRMGAAFPIPLIRTGLFASVGETTSRARRDPSVQSLNLAVSGADVRSLLVDRADALNPSQIDSETDLVLFPRTGSQMEIAEALAPAYAAVWIGNNDALGAVLAYDQLDASQLTPIGAFTADFTQIADRLAAMDTRAVFATIPDLTSIAYLLTPQDLVRFLGSSHGLPERSLTTLPAMFLVRLGLADGAIFSDPRFVLDPIEQQQISQRITAFNDVIRSVAASRNMAVAELGAVYSFLASQPFDVAGIPLTTDFLGGIFSLDGVHPSNFGQALAAFFFIDALNRHYGASIAQIDGSALFWFLLTDPFIDKDHDGRVTGRFGAGLLETLMSILGFSGDTNDQYTPTASVAADTARAPGSDASRLAALDAYQHWTGRDLRTMTQDDRTDALRELFSTRRTLPSPCTTASLR